MIRCHVCDAHIEREDAGYAVALRNGIFFPACFRHWFMWPDAHKSWPALGYGRDVVDVLRETAP